MKMNGIALVAVGILAATSPAFAAPSASLATGGRTLAGPGKNTVAAGTTQTLYTHPAINTDVCTTVVNGSKASLLRITLVDDSANETLLEVAAGTTAALCEDNVTRMDLTCLGTSNCTAQWRIDTK
jgi:hypothetical protein